MFGFSARRRNKHYRQSMRELQPIATELHPLRLANHYRSWDILAPFMISGLPRRERPQRDY